MSRGQRLLLVAAAAVVAVVAFAIVSPGGDDDSGSSERAGRTTEAGAGSTPEDAPAAPAPTVEHIRIRQGAVVGGPKRVAVETGDTVRIVVRADAPDEIHLHGYDITRNAAPGRPARFRFEARLEGDFEMESHVAADAGRNPIVARVVVEPS